MFFFFSRQGFFSLILHNKETKARTQQNWIRAQQYFTNQSPQTVGHPFKQKTGLQPTTLNSKSAAQTSPFGRRVKEPGRVLKSHHQHATRQPMPQPDRHLRERPPEHRHRHPRYAGARNRWASNVTTFLQLSELSAESILDLIEISSVLREPRPTATHTSHAIPDHHFSPLEPATQGCVSLHPPETKPRRRCWRSQPPPGDLSRRRRSFSSLHLPEKNFTTLHLHTTAPSLQ